MLATKVRGRMWDGPNGEGLSRGHMIRACEDSLRRLETDYIDLYQTHFFDADTPIDETLRALDDLVRAGKVRYSRLLELPGLAADEGALGQRQASAWRATTRSSRTTTWRTGPSSSASSSRSARKTGSASSPTARWPAAS